MSDDEFEKAIGYSRRPIGQRQTLWVAQVKFEATMTTDNSVEVPESQIKERLKLIMLRHFFDYDEQEILKAIMDLQVCPAFDYQSRQDCIEKILNAARHHAPKSPPQPAPPATDEKEG